jgi:hypothetical protein
MQPADPRRIKGRGAIANPANPFEQYHLEDDPEWLEEIARDPDAVPPSPLTVLFTDDTQTLITKNTSPDLSFEYSLNPYRGCEHGCSCFANL